MENTSNQGSASAECQIPALAEEITKAALRRVDRRNAA